MKTKQLLITCAATLFSLPACAATREVPFRPSPGAPFTDKMARYDYSAYQKIPDTPTSAVYRVVLKTLPYTRANAFYGNWAGNGSRGGKPVDAVDEIFRRHDIAYAEAKSIRTMKWADEACVEALKKLDPRTLSAEALEFRDRSSSFFSNRALILVGKPVTAVLRRKEAKDCPFQSAADVRELFGLEKSGTPAAKPQHRVESRTAQKMLASAKLKVKHRSLAGKKAKPVKPAATLRRLLARNP